jgi:hypothetical protein
MRGVSTVIRIAIQPSAKSAANPSSTRWLQRWELNGMKNASPARYVFSPKLLLVLMADKNTQECHGRFTDGRYFLRQGGDEPYCPACEEKRLKA